MGSPSKPAKRPEPAPAGDSDRKSGVPRTRSRDPVGQAAQPKDESSSSSSADSPTIPATGNLDLDDTVKSSLGGSDTGASGSSVASSKRAPNGDITGDPPAKKLKFDTQDSAYKSHRDNANDTNDYEDKTSDENKISDEDKTSDAEKTSNEEVSNASDSTEEEVNYAGDPTEEEVSDASDPTDDEASDQVKAGKVKEGIDEKEEASKEEESDEEDDSDAIPFDKNPPPPPEVTLNLSRGFKTRVPRQLLIDYTKLLDDDPNATSIHLQHVSEDEFKSWRKEVEKRVGLANTPWRMYGKYLMFKLLIIDEKVNGRYWKGFMERDVNGLNAIVNETFILEEDRTPKKTLSTLSQIAESTSSMPTSEIFRWACNGLHYIYQRQGYPYKQMKHILENYLPESTSPKAYKPITASFQYLEDKFGPTNQGSGQSHPGRLLQERPSRFSKEVQAYAKEKGVVLEEDIHGNEVLWRRKD